jgi:hypothetical protein
MTSHTPYPKRKNGYHLISTTKGEETVKEENKEDKFTEIP